MEKLELSSLNNLSAFGNDDKVLCYSQSLSGFGFVRVGDFANKGIACRRWNLSNASPLGEVYGNSQDIAELPEKLGLGCYLLDSGQNMKKLDPTNHHKFATGEAAALDGSMGDYMWGGNTEVYLSIWDEGGYRYRAISTSPIIGHPNFHFPAGWCTSALGAAVVDWNNVSLPVLCSVINSTYRYRGVQSEAEGSTAANTSYGHCSGNQTITNWMSMAKRKGQNYTAGWYAINTLIANLFYVIFGTLDVQATIVATNVTNGSYIDKICSKNSNGLYSGGLPFTPFVTAGYSSIWYNSGYGNYSYNPWWKTTAGVLNLSGAEIGDACGVFHHKNTINGVDYYGQTPCFFGLKNFYQTLWMQEGGSMIGINSDKTRSLYLSKSMLSAFAFGSATDATLAAAVSAGTVVRLNGNMPNLDGSISAMDESYLGMCPTAVSGSSFTYYADYFYHDADQISGFRVVLRRGSASGGASAGLASLDSNYAFSVSYARYSSPLCWANGEISPIPTTYTD